MITPEEYRRIMSEQLAAVVTDRVEGLYHCNLRPFVFADYVSLAAKLTDALIEHFEREPRAGGKVVEGE